MDGFKMLSILFGKFSAYHDPSGPRNRGNCASMFNLKGKYFAKQIFIIVIMIIIITLALDKDGILLQDVPSQASAVLVPISASHTGFT